MIKSSLTKVALKYGLIGSLIPVLLFTVLHLLGKNPLLITKQIPFSLLLIPVLIFFCVKEFRDYRNSGELRFWQGLYLGFVNYILIALISAVFVWMFINYYKPEILEEFIDFNMLNFQEEKAGIVEQFDEDTYERLQIDIRGTTAYHIGLDEFIRNVLIGFFSTFIVSMFLRK